MLTIIIAIVLGGAGFTAGTLFFDPLSGTFLGLAGLLLPPILIGRKVMKGIQARNKEAEAHMSAQRFDKAIACLEAMRPYGLWFPRMGSSIDGQIGMLMYATKKDADGALPYLRKAPAKLWHARAMLAAILFKKKEYDEMERVFDGVVKSNKKQPLLWAAYAYCQFRRGEKDRALAVLQRAAKVLPTDQRIPKHIAAIEKNKPPKMAVYGAEWYSLHIESPKMMPGAQQAGNRFMPPPGKLGARGGRRVRMR